MNRPMFTLIGRNSRPSFGLIPYAWREAEGSHETNFGELRLLLAKMRRFTEGVA